jgi:hypothetical protein
MRLPFFVVLLRVIAELHTMRCYLDALVDLQQHDPHQPRADQHTSRPDWELTHLRQGVILRSEGRRLSLFSLVPSFSATALCYSAKVAVITAKYNASSADSFPIQDGSLVCSPHGQANGCQSGRPRPDATCANVEVWKQRALSFDPKAELGNSISRS